MNMRPSCHFKLTVIKFLISILLTFLDGVLQPIAFTVIKAVCLLLVVDRLSKIPTIIEGDAGVNGAASAADPAAPSVLL